MKGKLLCLPNASVEAIEKGGEKSALEMCQEALQKSGEERLQNVLILGFDEQGNFLVQASENTSISHSALLLTLTQAYLATAYNGS